MKQVIFIATALAAMAACAPQVPDSGRGVGFGDYGQYEIERARREAALSGTVGAAGLPAAAPVSSGPINNASAIPSSDLARAGIGAGQPVSNTPVVGAPLSALNPQAVQNAPLTPEQAANLANNPGISDEQSFDAVAGRETIQSDAERRQTQAQALVVVDPVPLPATRANSGPNIVQYALGAPNKKGQEWYSRSILSGDNRFQRNCAGYNNADEAQRDFLSRGGPDRDPRGIDPDGDGFACGWDPAPFLLAAGR